MHRSIEIAPGLHLTGDGIAWLPAERALVVADVHVGYAQAVRRRGGFLPDGETGAAAGARLAAAAREWGAASVVVAGDLRHSTRDLDDAERLQLADLARAVGEAAELVVVLGNHDRGGAMVGRAAGRSLALGEFDIVHEPPVTLPARWTICGHLHPRVTMRDETGAGARYSCAMVGERVLILPAFSEWAGGVEASRLLRDLPPSRWRVLPMTHGFVADLSHLLRSDRSDPSGAS